MQTFVYLSNQLDNFINNIKNPLFRYLYYTNILTRAIYLTLKWLRNQICSNGAGRFSLNLLEFLVRIDSGNFVRSSKVLL